jgi:hypothetical protein
VLENLKKVQRFVWWSDNPQNIENLPRHLAECACSCRCGGSCGA